MGNIWASNLSAFQAKWADHLGRNELCNSHLSKKKQNCCGSVDKGASSIKLLRLGSFPFLIRQTKRPLTLGCVILADFKVPHEINSWNFYQIINISLECYYYWHLFWFPIKNLPDEKNTFQPHFNKSIWNFVFNL